MTASANAIKLTNIAANAASDKLGENIVALDVTELMPLSNYAAAEAYHQDYFENNPHQGYCAFVVAPKVQKFLQTFADRVKHD